MTVPSLLQTQVQQFYESDMISKQLPSRKDYVTIKTNGKKERVQKKVMTTLMEALQQFKKEKAM